MHFSSMSNRQFNSPLRGRSSGFFMGIGCVLLSFSLYAAGCSDDPQTSGGTGGNSSSSTSSTSSSGTGMGGNGTGGAGGAMQAECNPTPNTSNPAPTNIESASATVLDINGNALSSVLVQVCGLDQCFNGETNANGIASVIVNKDMKKPAFKYGGLSQSGTITGKFAALLAAGKNDLGNIVTLELPVSGSPLMAGKSAVSGGVTLTLAPGAGISHDSIVYDSDDLQAFRAEQVPMGQEPAGLDPALKLELLFAVSPIDSFFCPPAQVTVNNSPKWAAGTAVEFFVLGLSIGEEFAPYGEWAKVSDGVVSADGMTISTSAEGGLPVLSAFGIRKK